MTEENTQLLTIDVGKALRPSRAKLTTPKRKKFLQLLAESGNVSKSAAQVGVSRNSIQQLRIRDEKFSVAYDSIIQAFADRMEEVSISLACQPSREGLGDRKLQLQRIRPNEYIPNRTEITINNQVNLNNAPREIERILSNNALDTQQIQDAEIIE